MNLSETNTIAFDKLSESNQLYILKTAKKASDEMPILVAKIEAQAEMLKANGFVEGVHFIRKQEERTRSEYVYYGDYKREGRNRYFFEYKSLEAWISLKYKRFNNHDGQILDCSTSVDINSDNNLIGECGYIMTKRGRFKPKTILERLKYLNELAENEKIHFDKKASTLELAMQEFINHYPTAKVTSHKNHDWRNNGQPSSYDVVKVQFPSGSYVDIIIRNDEDKIVKAHDAELSNLSITQTLNKFRDQKPKEDAKI